MYYVGTLYTVNNINQYSCFPSSICIYLIYYYYYIHLKYGCVRHNTLRNSLPSFIVLICYKTVAVITRLWFCSSCAHCNSSSLPRYYKFHTRSYNNTILLQYYYDYLTKTSKVPSSYFEKLKNRFFFFFF